MFRYMMFAAVMIGVAVASPQMFEVLLNKATDSSSTQVNESALKTSDEPRPPRKISTPNALSGRIARIDAGADGIFALMPRSMAEGFRLWSIPERAV